MNTFDDHDTLSFDCYGTLIDWETGIAAALRRWAAARQLSLSDAELVAAHARHETGAQQDHPSALYPYVLGETLRRIGIEFGVGVTDDEAHAYGASAGEWPAFSDSADALSRLANRYKLVILSNVDRASFARSNEKLGVEFDLIITAEDVGSYKPNLANFEALFQRLPSIGAERSRLLHVAESLYHDHEPANRLHLPSVWINRVHTSGGASAAPKGSFQPERQFPTLAAFADAILS